MRSSSRLLRTAQPPSGRAGRGTGADSTDGHPLVLAFRQRRPAGPRARPRRPQRVLGPRAAALAAAREVVTVDLPGHGSTPPLAGPLSLDRLTDGLQEWLVVQDLAEADLVGSSMGARMVLELARRGVGRHVVALDPGGFWSAAEKRVFATSVKASFALVKALRPALPLLAGSAAGRTAMLPQFTPRPWAVPAEVALADLRKHRGHARPVPDAPGAGRQRAAARRTDAGPRAARLGTAGPGDPPPPGRPGAGGVPPGHPALVRPVRAIPMWDRPQETVQVVLAATA